MQRCGGIMGTSGSNSKFQQFFFLILFSILLGLGSWSCTKGGEPVTGGPGPGEGFGAKGNLNIAKPACETEQFKNDSRCQLVLAGFEGSFKTLNNPIEVHAVVKNTYREDGKLLDTLWYASEDSDSPFHETHYTYRDKDGKIALVEEKNDDDLLGDFDSKTKLENTYDSDDRLTGFTFTSEPIPNPSGLFSYKVQKTGGYVPPLYSGDIYESFNGATQPSPIYTAVLQFLNSANLPESELNVKADYTDPAHPKQLWGEIKTISYTSDNKPQTIDQKWVDCGNYTWTPPTGCINGGVNPPTINSPAEPYAEITTEFFYTDGRITSSTQKIDGDYFNAGKYQWDGTDDYTWSCQITYDPSNQKVIAEFPEQWKSLGLSETDKIESISCDDGGVGLIGIKLENPKWVYLWQAVPGMEEPQ